MKKGISLIVLIVTIIVIIILAAAVILTLNRNNPIDSGRIAQVADNRASINSALQLYYGKKMAETQGVFETQKIFIGGTATFPSDNNNTITLNSIVGSELGSTVYYELNATTESALDIKIPGMSGAKWYLDTTTGLAYLGYTSKSVVPAWMKDSNGNMDSSLNEFVRVEKDSDLVTYDKAE